MHRKWQICFCKAHLKWQYQLRISSCYLMIHNVTTEQFSIVRQIIVIQDWFVCALVPWVLGPVKLHNLFRQSGPNWNQLPSLEKKIKRGVNLCITQFHEPILLKTLTTSISDTQEAAGESTSDDNSSVIRPSARSPRVKDWYNAVYNEVYILHQWHHQASLTNTDVYMEHQTVREYQP